MTHHDIYTCDCEVCQARVELGKLQRFFKAKIVKTKHSNKKAIEIAHAIGVVLSAMKCYESMKEGVAIRIAGLEAKIKELEK